LYVDKRRSIKRYSVVILANETRERAGIYKAEQLHARWTQTEIVIRTGASGAGTPILNPLLKPVPTPNIAPRITPCFWIFS
jgi:hypothetical protein